MLVIVRGADLELVQKVVLEEMRVAGIEYELWSWEKLSAVEVTDGQGNFQWRGPNVQLPATKAIINALDSGGLLELISSALPNTPVWVATSPVEVSLNGQRL